MRIAVLAAASLLCAADMRVISPPGLAVAGPHSPGILAGDFLYVSGQGADGAGQPEQQIAQALGDVRRVVEAAGLTMDHLVYAQVHLRDMKAHEHLDRAWKRVFPKNGPARAVLGVARLPGAAPVEINAVAVKDVTRKSVLPMASQDSGVPAGVFGAGRFYFSGVYESGRDPVDAASSALDRLKRVLEAAGLSFAHVVFVNPYLTAAMPMEPMNREYAKRFEFGNTPARATIRVSSLPHEAMVEFTGVAVRDLARRGAVRPKNMEPSPTASPCVWAGDALFCSAKAGFIPGPHGGIFATTAEHQLRQTMRNLLDGLEEAGLKFSNVVSTSVYADNLEEYGALNQVYAEYFPEIKPTRTTVQPAPPVERKPDSRGRYPKLEEVSLIAVK